MKFNELFAANDVTNRERDALAWRLSMMRARALYELLRPAKLWDERRRK